MDICRVVNGMWPRVVDGVELIRTMQLMLCLNMRMPDAPPLIWPIYVILLTENSLYYLFMCVCARGAATFLFA